MRVLAKPFLLISTLVLASSALSAHAEKVNAFNFARAESDRYMSNLLKRNGGLGKLTHERKPPSIDDQVVIRMNRDTLYSSGVYDLQAGAVHVSMPADTNGRFQSLQVISQDHFTPFVIYDGKLTLTKEKVGTRYALLVFRTYVNANSEADIAATHALQDQILVEQAAAGSFEIPDWDTTSLKETRDALKSLQAMGGTLNRVRMGPDAASVDQLAHLMATATGWGLNPQDAAIYSTDYPEANDGKTIHTLELKDVPVTGFWSVSVYNEEGFFEKNTLGAYSLNSGTATPDADGKVTIQFGGCDGKVLNCLPTPENWNYSLRLYRPGKPLLNGEWTVPTAQPVAN